MQEDTGTFIGGLEEGVCIRQFLSSANRIGLRLIRAADGLYNEASFQDILHQYDGLIFEKLGMVLFRSTECRMYHLISGDQLPGLQFVEHESELFTAQETSIFPPGKEDPPWDWGLQQMNIHRSPYKGEGVRIALLDTGIDLQHPDFQSSHIVAQSFVEGESEQDQNGHGTHGAGLLIAGEKTTLGIRYSVVPNAELYVGKVLRNSGSSPSRYLMMGINWALEQQCKVITISMGSRIRRGVPYSTSYEKMAKAALDQGCLIISAAGNDSFRHLDRLMPVAEPANCPSIMAVGAINYQQKMYNRSNAAVNPDTAIDLVAPGVGILSSFVGEQRYKALSGTSMATAYAAGIAVQHLQAQPDLTPLKLRALLRKRTQALNLPERDTGAGLIQAYWD